MTFAERLKELRKESGMSLSDIAMRIGVSKVTVHRYETGKIANVPVKKVHQIANIFHVTRPYMMGWTDERHADPAVNLDMVAGKLLDESNHAVPDKEFYWKTEGTPTADYTTAATQAARALIKFGVSRTPIYPQQIIQASQIATMVSFEHESEVDELTLCTRLTNIRHTDLVFSSEYETAEGKIHHLFAVNRNAPLGHLKLALAVELGHIYLGHSKYLLDARKKREEAQCFAIHLEFPRALIRMLEERGFVFTKKTFSRIFGDCEWCLDSILNASPVVVSPELNRLVKEQFTPYVNQLDEIGILSIPVHGEELDLSTYMAGYEE